MKVKNLIKELQKQDPEKEVMIQQGIEFDYTTVHSVKEAELIDMNNTEEENWINVIVIEYN